LYSLLAKYSNIVRRDPNSAGTVKMERHLTNDLKPMNKGVRSFIENSVAARIALKIFGVLGVSMVMVSLLEALVKSVLTPWFRLMEY
jgi:KUP system potassium uptake protein